MKAPAPLTQATLRRLHAQDIVLQHTSLAGACMVIPVPLLDIATALAVQLRMAKKLCVLYGARFDRTAARGIITGALGNLSPDSVRAMMLRYLSFVSCFTGTLPSAALNAAYTYILGELLLERLIANGRIDMPSPHEYKSSASPGLSPGSA